ncbi:BCL-6 corepressor-like protein 1, partial [Cherax quadricarinatus]|uniref:BCL-6 corepressor-like protein 1 n=1 Tax=Cherax quadricarinatus TaxID=27406 RepID=UPI00387E467D
THTQTHAYTCKQTYKCTVREYSVVVESGWKDQTDWREDSVRVRPLRHGPYLLPGLPTNVSTIAGRLATLPCRVANLKGRAVSWIRQEDLKVLATDGVTFTSDSRLQVRAWRAGVVWAWDLEIEEATLEDAGVYECQVNTRPKISHPVTLHVHVGGAVIPGPTDVYVEHGSRLLLTCWVYAPPRPPGPMIWLHNHSPIHAHGSRGGVSLHVAHEGARASARLSLTSVTLDDAGNYTCQPQGLDAASVTVYVMQTCQPVSLPACQPASLPACKYTSQPSNLPDWKPESLPACQPPRLLICHPDTLAIFQPASLTAYQLANLPVFQPASLPACQPASFPACHPISLHLPAFQPASPSTCQPSSLPAYQHANLPAFQLPAYQPSSLPAYQPANLPALKPANLPAYQSSNLPAYQPANLPALKPASLPACQPASHQSSNLPAYQPVSLSA